MGVSRHVIGHLLVGPGPVHLLLRGIVAVTGVQDRTCSFGPWFVGRLGRDHPEVASVPEIGAEGLLGAASKVALLGGGQLKDSLCRPPAAAGAKVVPEPGVGGCLPDLEIDDGQPPHGDQDPDQGRIARHASE